ncbi:unnamed protein product, partial [Amoebophrya sp. A25]
NTGAAAEVYGLTNHQFGGDAGPSVDLLSNSASVNQQPQAPPRSPIATPSHQYPIHTPGGSPFPVPSSPRMSIADVMSPNAQHRMSLMHRGMTGSGVASPRSPGSPNYNHTYTPGGGYQQQQGNVASGPGDHQIMHPGAVQNSPPIVGGAPGGSPGGGQPHAQQHMLMMMARSRSG